MRVPRRAAAVLSAVALAGALTACGDDAGTQNGVEEPIAPADPGIGGEIDEDGVATEPE